MLSIYKIDMRKIVFLFVIFLFLASANSVFGQEAPTDFGFVVKKGQRMPDFKVQKLNGGKINTKKLRGKVILLDFWGAKCGGCLLALKRFPKEVIEVYGKRKDFFLLPVEAQKNTEADIRASAKRMGLDFPLAFENGQNIAELFFNRNFGLPRTLIIDREGKIVYMAYGYTEEEFSRMLEVLKKTMEKNE